MHNIAAARWCSMDGTGKHGQAQQKATAFHNGIVGIIGVTEIRCPVPLKRHRTAEPGAPLLTVHRSVQV
jgi:hypothetical protein